MSPACQGLIFVTCFAASRQGGGESLPDDGEMAGRMRPRAGVESMHPVAGHTSRRSSPQYPNARVRACIPSGQSAAIVSARPRAASSSNAAQAVRRSDGQAFEASTVAA